MDEVEELFDRIGKSKKEEQETVQRLRQERREIFGRLKDLAKPPPHPKELDELEDGLYIDRIGAEYGHVDFAYLQGHKHTFLSYDLEEGDFTDMTWYEQELGTNTWLEKERE